MKISVVTISYNQYQFLGECINSVLTQDYPDIEYLVVDPGSTDGSRDLIAAYGDRIRAILEKDSGPADGLNRGFAHASGDVLCFLNSDDYFLPGAFRAVAKAFRDHPEVDVICGAGYIVDVEGRPNRRLLPTAFTPSRFALEAVTIFQQGVFFRKSAYSLVGGFNLCNKTCWDAELFLDMALNGSRFKLINSYVACFRVHDASITGSGRLNIPFQTDRDRLFKKAMGRQRRYFDVIPFAFARVYKWVCHPRRTILNYFGVPRAKWMSKELFAESSDDL